MSNVNRAFVLDVGSVSVRLLVGEKTSESPIRIIHDEGWVTKLSQEFTPFETLNREAFNRTLGRLTEIFHRVQLPVLGACIGTQVLRSASNGEKFCEVFHKLTGHRLKIIDAEREGLLAWKGSSDILCESDLLMDLGGGSTEFIWRSAGEGCIVSSIPIGAATILRGSNHREAQSCRTAQNLMHKAEFAFQHLLETWRNIRFSRLVVLGGTGATLAAIQSRMKRYFRDCVHGFQIGLEDIAKIQDMLMGLSLDERERIVGMEPGRGEIILGGSAIFLQIMKMLRFETATISEHGIRYGLLEEILTRD